MDRWPNWIRHLATNEEIAGSSPARFTLSTSSAGGWESLGLWLNGRALAWLVGDCRFEPDQLHSPCDTHRCGVPHGDPIIET